jgi:hypothetical protein
LKQCAGARRLAQLVEGVRGGEDRTLSTGTGTHKITRKFNDSRIFEDAGYIQAEPDLDHVEPESFREKISKSHEKSITCVFHE